MNQLTSKELTIIEEGLHAEMMLIEKIGAHAAQATDPQLKQACFETQRLHQRHAEMLMQQLGGNVNFH